VVEEAVDIATLKANEVAEEVTVAATVEKAAVELAKPTET